ncbi:MAG: right-handed parallel beta-helix repeat-containing protein [Bacteroidales bacterium]|nr:right-handed parallel beta-helix repeat-containing protein [Bacteroidales bacterium]
MKRTATILLFMTALCLGIQAQYGPVGFVNHNDGINGITGGMKGTVVRVTNRQDLATYAKASQPYTIIVEGRFEGSGLNRSKDVISVASDKTIIGVKGAELAGIGLDINGKQNIIIRNLVIHHADPDAIAVRNSHHIWIDHCEFYSQDETKEDWDGLVDLTSGSSYLTVSYCYMHDHHKACLLNSGTMHFEDNGKNRATYHHNAFMRIDQRSPRIGYGLAHVFNNYYQDIGSYAVGGHTQAQIVTEKNHFGTSVRHPFENMYASSTDDASCAFWSDRGSHFTTTPATDFKHRQTGTSFEPSLWYGYDFALEEAADIARLYPTRVGQVDGLEHEPILWPGNGAIDISLGAKPAYSPIEGMTGTKVLWGTDKNVLREISLDSLRLQPSTTYYWQVLAQTADSSYRSPVYCFTTAGVKAAKPTPADGEFNARLRVAASAEAKTAAMPLSWRPAAEAQSYRVYLATDADSLDQAKPISTNTVSCQPGSLRYGQTYFWRVDVIKASGDVVTGDVWRFSAPARPVRVGRTELEHLTRGAYAYLEREDGSWFKASNDSVIVGEAGPGAVTGVWEGENGSYEISVDFYDEAAGQAGMFLSVNDRQIDFWKGVKQYGMTTHRINKEVTLHRGDQIRIDFYTQGKMRSRIDCIDIKLKALAIGQATIPDDTGHETVIYDLTGRRVAAKDLRPGIYIVNGRKIAVKTAAGL